MLKQHLETTFDYCSPEIARKCAEDMSDDIPDTENNPQKLLLINYGTSSVLGRKCVS